MPAVTHAIAQNVPSALRAPTRITVAKSPGEGVALTNLEELARYRLDKKQADAVGVTMPPISLPIDPAVPARVQAIMDAVDALLPKLMTDKGLTLEAIFHADPDARRGDSSTWHKTVLGANIAAAVGLGTQIAAQVSGLADVAAVAAIAHASWKAAGAASYTVHHALDNYDCFGTDSFEFQVHHEAPQDLAHWGAALTTHNIGAKVLPLLVATAVMGPSLPVATAALVFLGGVLTAPLAHQWQHRKPSAVVGALQGAGVLARGHAEHHGGNRVGLMESEAPQQHAGAYDILTGDLGGSVNGLFDKLAVPRRVEALVYRLTGVEPNSWKEYPELKAIWTAPAEDRAGVARRERIAKQERNIAAFEQKLETARTQTGKVAEAIVAGFPKRIDRMKQQLAAFLDPSLLKPLFDEQDRAERALVQLMSPTGMRARALDRDRYMRRFRDAEAALAKARAALVDAAPFLDGSVKSVP